MTAQFKISSSDSAAPQNGAPGAGEIYCLPPVAKVSYRHSLQRLPSLKTRLIPQAAHFGSLSRGL
jgi:hypothetical protein